MLVAFSTTHRSYERIACSISEVSIVFEEREIVKPFFETKGRFILCLILPPHKISYRLDNGEEKVVWEFINLPSGKNDVDFINDFYMKGTCGDYSCRKFYFNLNFSTQTPRGLFNLPVGEHQIDVLVEDMVGNKATKNFKWKVL